MSGFSRSWFSNGGGGSYRAVGDRCAVDLGRLLIAGLHTDIEKRAALESVGCTIVSMDPVALARLFLATREGPCATPASPYARVGQSPSALAWLGSGGHSVYRRGARASEAPGVVDCSSFMKWIFGQAGIWIPRRSIQQRDCVGNGGHAVNDRADVRSGDLVFVTGWKDYYDVDPAQGVGHVGIVTSDRTVVHAANSELGVTESPLEEFLYLDRFRGARRMIPDGRTVLTLQTPPEREVETEDDLRWMILQRMA